MQYRGWGCGYGIGAINTTTNRRYNNNSSEVGEGGGVEGSTK